MIPRGVHTSMEEPVPTLVRLCLNSDFERDPDLGYFNTKVFFPLIGGKVRLMQSSQDVKSIISEMLIPSDHLLLKKRFTCFTFAQSSLNLNRGHVTGWTSPARSRNSEDVEIKLI